MNSEPKVFIILSPGFAASEVDSSCLPMQQSFVRALSAALTNVSVMVLSFHYPFVTARYNWFGASVTSFNGANKGGIRRVFLRRRVRGALEQLHREKEIVGILSFWLGECALVGKRFAEEKGLRHYCWILGQDARPGNKYAAWLSLEDKELIALSDSLQEEFERNYGVRPARVIPPGVERRVKTKKSRDIDLIAAGSLIPLKRFELFLRAVADIKKELPCIKAMLVGDGPEFGKLKRMASLLALDDTVHFAGSIGHDEVVNRMARSRVLLHPSSFEGYSGVCQEALSCGAHVISFCRAMKTDAKQWHIVQSTGEMTKQALVILKDTSTSFESVEFESMTCTARRMMDLYEGT